MSKEKKQLIEEFQEKYGDHLPQKIVDIVIPYFADSVYEAGAQTERSEIIEVVEGLKKTKPRVERNHQNRMKRKAVGAFNQALTDIKNKLTND